MTASNPTLPVAAANAAADAPSPVPQQAQHRHYVWDLPLRLFHWGLVLAVSTAIATGLAGGDWMQWHGRAGTAIIALLSFRLSWGFLGSTHARFSHFWPTPRKLLAYLQGRWQGTGHNPLGALSVWALLLALAYQAGSGLYGNDDIAFTGPLAARVSDELSHQLTGLHRQFSYAIYALLGLHLAAILFYVLVKKKRLVRPMVTGWQETQTKTEEAPATPTTRWPALVIALLIAASSTYLATGGWPQSSTATVPTAAQPTTPPSTPNW